MRSKTKVLNTILLLLAIIILINYLAFRFSLRIDLTDDKRFSLSKATKNIIKNLDEPVTITAYFSKKLPPDYENVRRDFRDLLIEYKNVSKGMIQYEFVDPTKDEELERKIMQKGIVQAQIPGREKDEFKIQKAYMGAEIQMGNNSEIISLIQSTQGMEYFLTSSIKKLSVKEKPFIGFVQGHGEPSLDQLSHVVHALNVLYQVEAINLNDSSLNIDKYKTFVIIAPKDTIPDDQLAKLDEALAKGKSILVAINRVDANLNESPMGYEINTGLEKWLENKGIKVNPVFVLDAKNVPVGIQREAMTPFGPGIITQQIAFPYFPLVQKFVEHPITTGLEQVVFQFVSSITFNADTSLVFTPIVKTSEHSATQSAYSYFNVLKNWTKEDFPLSDITIAIAVEGPFVNKTKTRMVVFGDGDFPIASKSQRPNPDNINLLVNAIDWLSDDTGLIELRTKGATSRPLKEDLSDGTRTFLKYLNFLLPILLTAVFGFVRYEHRRNQRIKRMEVGHV